jgi:hypothetical protein
MYNVLSLLKSTSRQEIVYSIIFYGHYFVWLVTIRMVMTLIMADDGLNFPVIQQFDIGGLGLAHAKRRG